MLWNIKLKSSKNELVNDIRLIFEFQRICAQGILESKYIYLWHSFSLVDDKFDFDWYVHINESNKICRFYAISREYEKIKLI